MATGFHPDDERLSALAWHDADARADRALTAHVATCARCRPIVDDLSAMRAALAALPDIVPSRPLQLVPPAPEPVAAPVGPLAWLRRLAAPAMAAGAVMVLVGVIGSSAGPPASMFLMVPDARNAAGAPEAQGSEAPVSMPVYGFSTDNPDRTGGAAEYGPSAAPLPTDDSQRPVVHQPVEAAATGWIAVAVAGLALVAAGVVLRFAISPRAG